MDFFLYGFHIAALIFWVRLWSAPAREFYFNPFLSGTMRLTDSVLAFLRPVLFMPERAAALAVLIFVLLFKTVVTWRFGGDWLIRVGRCPPRIAPFLWFCSAPCRLQCSSCGCGRSTCSFD